MIDAGIGATRAAARAKSPDGFARWQACCRGDTAAEEFSYDERNICAGSQACASLDQRPSGWRWGDNSGRRIRTVCGTTSFVMPALVPGIQALLAAKEGVEGRDNAMSRL